MKPGHPHHQHRARRADRRGGAARARSRAASSPAPGSTCSRRSRRPTGRWRRLPQVVATPHIAASTEEAQELVGLDTAAAVRDFLRDGVVRNAVNFPSVHPDELQRLQPWIRLADQLAAIVAQMGAARIEAIGAALLRRAGRQPGRRRPRLERRGRRAAADPVGRRLDRQRARGGPRARHRDHRVAQHAARGTSRAWSRSSCTRATGERWAEGTVFEPNSPRLVSVRGDQRRSAARRHAADHLQRRSAGRHRRGRHDSRPARRQHRELRARPQRDRRGWRGQRRRGSERAAAPSTRRSRRSGACRRSATPGSSGCRQSTEAIDRVGSRQPAVTSR